MARVVNTKLFDILLAKCINNFAKQFSILGIAQRLQQPDVVLSHANIRRSHSKDNKAQAPVWLSLFFSNDSHPIVITLRHSFISIQANRVALVAQHLWPGSQAHNVAVLVSSLFSSTAACNSNNNNNNNNNKSKNNNYHKIYPFKQEKKL
uniref:Uncharacterized protein n=1 Tax=Glossina pallidipes TaxID=7398 RepID=A0A1A9ZMD0_GLOPL